MLTVYSVLWGDKYPSDYVYRLRNAVTDRLFCPHRFVCVTDSKLSGIETIKPIKHWHGWWQKLTLFYIATGPSLYFDLDCVITGDLDYLAEYTLESFAAPANWGQSGHGGVQSSVMAWNGRLKFPYDNFNYGVDDQRLWGDQEFLTECLGDNFTKLPRVASYKYHCQRGVPDDTAVVTFHGKPDYHECFDAWILQYMQTYS